MRKGLLDQKQWSGLEDKGKLIKVEKKNPCWGHCDPSDNCHSREAARVKIRAGMKCKTECSLQDEELLGEQP